jgi:1,4-dihydroxy-2-naphthoate octaprenyltransferase
MKKWLKAMRLRTLPLASSVVFAGASTALETPDFSVAVFFLLLATVLLLQILSNLANDYGDFEHGTDNEHRVGPKRSIQAGEIRPEQMKKAMIITSMVAFVFGIITLWLSFGAGAELVKLLVFLILGLTSIAAAIKYTAGKNPYGYRGLGDLFVFLFFGIIGVIGVHYVLAHSWNWGSVWNAVAIGALSTGVLNLNNLRDHVNDRSSGKNTMIVQLGFASGKVYHYFILLTAGVAMLISVWQNQNWVALLPLLIVIANGLKVMSTQDPAELDPELKKVAITALFFSLLQLLPHSFLF